jgi:VIT1/CCC1 family predicted Fe2+/Mn2+ transporter
VVAVVVVTLVGLMSLGGIGARLGGADPVRPAMRLVAGGAAAMLVAALVGNLFDVSVS